MTRIYSGPKGVQVDATIEVINGRELHNVEAFAYRIFTGSSAVKQIKFHHAANSPEGVTMNALLAVLIHQARFRNRKSPSSEGEKVIADLKSALATLETIQT